MWIVKSDEYTLYTTDTASAFKRACQMRKFGRVSIRFQSGLTVKDLTKAL